jgi:hypothetical protein
MKPYIDIFFKWLWRLCGIFALIILGTTLLGIFGLASNLSKKLDSPPQEKITHIAGNDLSDKHLRLGSFVELRGSTYLYAYLEQQKGELKGASLYGASSNHNILIFNLEDKKANWLLSTDNMVIPYNNFIFWPRTQQFSNDQTRSQTPVALLYTTMNPGSDIKIQNLFISSIDGKNSILVRGGIDGILSYYLQSERNLLIFYVQNGFARVLDFDLVEKKVISNDQIGNNN